MTVPSHQSMYSGDPSRGGTMVLFLILQVTATTTQCK